MGEQLQGMLRKVTLDAIAPINFSEQRELLHYCLDRDLNLHDELAERNLCYDDLCYRYNPEVATTSNRDRPFSPVPFHGIPVVSFFSGAGGLDLGFEMAGFEHLACLEINPTFCQTLSKNRPDWKVYDRDICHREATLTLLQETIGIQAPFEGIFIGGPPCQPFSLAANQRFSKQGENFKRVGFDRADLGNLLFDFIFYIQYLQPRAFLIENVTGLKTIDGGKQLTIALNSLADSGYAIAPPTVLNAAEFGIPQQRERLFVVGFRGTKSFQFPSRDRDRIPCYNALTRSLDGVANHITRKHKAASILRYAELKYGERDRLGRVDRLHPNLPSKTIIAGGSLGGGRSHLHPVVPRTLSVRESARLQTFPDEFVFCGSVARQFTQVGNAVPPLLAAKLASEIYRQY